MVMQDFGPDTWLTIADQPSPTRIGQPLRFSSQDDNKHLQIGEKKQYHIYQSPDAPRDLQIFIDDTERKTLIPGYWEWAPDNDVGIHEIRLSASGHTDHVARVFVYPTHVTWLQYKELLEDISSVCVDLLFRIRSPAYGSASIHPKKPDTSPLREYEFLKHIMSEMTEAMEGICHDPHSEPSEQEEARNLDELDHIRDSDVPLVGSTIAIPPDLALHYENPDIPDQWLSRKEHITYDVYENRLLKYFIHYQLIESIKQVRKQAIDAKKYWDTLFNAHLYTRSSLKVPPPWTVKEKENSNLLSTVIGYCQDMAEKCRVWHDETFLQSIEASATPSKASSILLHNRYYRQFYDCYIHLQNAGLHLNTEKFVASLAFHKMSHLYEVWAVLKMKDIIVEELLNASYECHSDTLFFPIEKDRFQFDMERDSDSIVLKKGKLKAVFKYEPIYWKDPPKPGVPLVIHSEDPRINVKTPDFAVEFYSNKTPKHVLLFDAKYNGHHPEGQSDSLQTIRTYKDVIQYRASTSPPSFSPICSAYMLYPGKNLYYSPPDSENAVGALPLSPKMDVGKREKIRKEIRDKLHDLRLLE
jgi:Domain of unknown function (DUF2357)/PD-(D/E)XK nuclease superfamily